MKMEKVKANCSNKIWLFSSISYEVEVLVDHPQFLHSKISSDQLLGPLLFTSVYAKFSRKERVVLWNELRQFASTSLLWAIDGDFNIITNATGKKGRCSAGFKCHE